MDKVKLAAIVREIGKVAPQVGKEFADQKAAFEEERAASEKLLTSVIEMAKPGLAAISNSIPSAIENGILLWEGKTRLSRPLRVYLLENGDLYEEWQVQDDDTDEWHNTGKVRTPRYVVEKYDVPNMITGLHTALTKQAGKRVPSTQRAKDGAARVNAILTLLDAPPAANDPVYDADEIPF